MAFIKVGVLALVLLFSTVSSASPRSKRSFMDHGKWCGTLNTKLGSPGCNCEAGIEKCRELYPPIDELDEVCLSHDWCSRCPSNPAVESYRPLHWCQCEQDIYTNANSATCYTSHCDGYKAAMRLFFKYVPCVCEQEGKCGLEWCTKTIFGTEISYPCGHVSCETISVVSRFSKCQNIN
ncbi:unnamed protein product [Owenia fusiformis]|uniref:Uncharacterized protein n=1 Tax=Owenia fusiformis TaxID=6347 RepID=A0A8J1UBZ9_OWEFU|nr:unnamed protein product [Owenia fusiformis]